MASDEIKEAKELLRLKQEEIRKEIQLNGVTSERLKLLQREERAMKSSLNQLNETYGALDDMGKKQRELTDGMNQFGQAIANLPLGDYLNLVPDSKDISKELGIIRENIEKVSREINQDFAKQKLAIPKPNTKAFKSVISELEMKQAGLGKALEEALTSGDIASFYRKYGDEGRKLAKEAMDKKKGFVGVATYFGKEGQGPKDLKTFQEGMRALEDEAKTFYRITFDTGKLWQGIRQNILQNFGIGKIIAQVRDFDNKLANIKKEFQIPVTGFKGASEAMADLTIKGAKFGLSTAESFEMVKTIGEEMRSTNVKAISEIAQKVAAVPAAFGIASTEVSKITGQMMFFGMHTDKVESAFRKIGKQSAVFGQNATKVAKQFGEAYPKFKMMGMKGNESAIAAMAAQAEKLGINLADSVTSSKDFLDIGEAMEASADLSLLGGAAAQVSYADLMMARLDPKKMIEIQDKVTAGLGKFNKATGEVDFGYAELVQLQQLATRLGVKQEDLMKRAKGQREDAAKAAMFDKNMFSGLSPEEKTFLLSKVVSKGGGKFGVEGLEGITDLKSVGRDQIKAMMQGAVNDKKKTEDLAKERASFDETVQRMQGTIMALFNRFQPILQMLTNVLGKVIDVAQRFSNAISNIFGATVGKYVKASLALGAILMLTFGPSAMMKFSGILFRGMTSPIKMLSGFGAKMSAAFKGGGGKAAESLTEKAGGATADLGTKSKGPKAGPTFLQQFSKINPAQILSVAAAIVALGIAFLMIGKGIKLAAEGMATFVNAFKGLNPAQLQAAKSALLGFGIGITVIMGVLAALAFSGIGPAAIGIMLGFGAAMLMVGGGVYLASKGLAYLATSMASIGKNVGNLFKGIGALYSLAGALLMISPALLVFGVAGLVAAPGMLALGYLLKGLGAAKGVNPGIIKAIGSSMGSIAWGLFKLGAAAVVAPLAILSAMALNFVASSINKLGAIDSKKVIGFGNTLNLFASSVMKGMLKLGLVGLASPFALVAAVSINLISKLLNSVKPIDEKNMTAFGKSLGSIGFRIAWGLTKLALIAIPATLAIPGALMLSMISKLLNGVQPVNEANMASFGKSLTNVGPRVLLGLTALSAVSVLGILAIPGAFMLSTISKLLNGVKPVDEKNMEAFGRSLTKVGGSVMWGMLKLSMISALGVLAVPGALFLNTISRLLNGVKPVDEKNMDAFGNSLGKVGGSVMWGLLKLSAVAVLGVLALPGAAMLNAISRLLGGVKPVDEKNMASFGQSLTQVGPRVMSGIKALALIALPSILAGVAANRIAAISKSLNAVTPINQEKMVSFANAMTKVSGKMVWGVAKLGLIAIPAIFAVKAANYLISISKSLNSITPVDSKKISAFSSSLNMVSGKMVWSMAKLALLSIPAIPATTAANRLATISKALNSITTVSPTKISSLSKAMSSVGGWALTKLALLAIPARGANSTARSLMSISKNLGSIATVNQAKIAQLSKAMSSVGGWALSKLALLAIPAKGALSTASSLFRISLNLLMIAPVNTKKIESLTQGMKSVSGWALTKFSLLSVPAKGALSTATSLMNLSKNLNSIVQINLVKIFMLNQAMGIVSSLKGRISTLASMGSNAGKASMTAFRLFQTSMFLTMVKQPNVAAMQAFGQALEAVSDKVVSGVKRLASIFKPISFANISSAYLLGISRNLSLVKSPNIPAMEAFGQSLTIISGKVMWGVTKLGLLVGPLVLANKSASLLLNTSRSLSLVKAPNIPAMTAFGKSLEIISGKVMWGVTKLGLLAGPLTLANKSASLLASTSKSLGLVEAPNIPAMGAFGRSLAIISGKVMWGVVKLGLLAGPLALANKAASLMASTSTKLLQVRAPQMAPIQAFGQAMGQISGKMMWGVNKLAMLAIPLGVAIISAKLIIKLSKTLISASDSLLKMAQTINKVPVVQTAGLNSLRKALDKVGLGFSFKLGKFALVKTVAGSAVEAAMQLVKISFYLNAVKTVNPKNITQLGSTLSSVSSKIKKGLDGFSKLKDSAVKAQLASAMLILISANLSKVTKVSKTPILSLATVLTYMGPKVKRGLTVLGTVAPLAPLGIITAFTLSKLGQLLNKIPIVSSVPLKRLSSALGSVGLGFAKNLFVFGGMSVVALAALASAKVVNSIAKFLSTTPMVSAKPIMALNQLLKTIGGGLVSGLRRLAGLGNVGPIAQKAATNLAIITKELSKAVGPNTKALSALGFALSSIVKAVPAINRLSTMNAVSKLAAISAKQIVSISKSLKQIPDINLKLINNLASVLSGPMNKIRKGIVTLGRIAVFIPGAISASKGLGIIGKNLKEIPQVPFAGLTNLVRVLSVQMSKMTSGLQQLSRASKSVSGAIATAQGLVKIANSLRTIAQVPLAGFLSLSRVLSTQMNKIVKGVKDLGKASPSIPGSIIAAQGLSKIGNFIRQIPQVSILGLSSLGLVLSTQMMRVLSGLKQLVKAAFNIPASIISAQGLVKIANSIKQIPQVFFLGLSSLGGVLSSQMPKVINGIKILSKSVPYIPSSTVSAQGLVKIAVAIKQIPQVFFLGLSSLGKVLSSQMPKVLVGIKHLSKTATFIPSSIVSAQGLVKIANAIKQIPQVFFLGLFSLGNVLASRMPIVLRGIKMLAKATPFIPSSIISSNGLVRIANAIKQVPQVFYLGLFSLGNVLSTRMPAVLNGIKLLTKAYPFVPTSIVASSGLSRIANMIKAIPQVFFLGLFSLGRVLTSQMPILIPGLKNLSKSFAYIPTSIFSAQGLVKIANSIKQIPQVFYLGLFTLGRVLSSQMPRVVEGVKQLNKAAPFIASAIVTSRGLSKVANAIKLVPQVFFLGLFSLGRVLSSQMPRVVNGIRMLSRIATLIPNSITSAKGLQKVSTEVKKIPQVFFLGLFSLGRVLSSQMPRVLSGIRMLIRVFSLIPLAIVSAKGLAKVSSAIKTIPQVFFLGLWSLGRVLVSQMPRVIVGLRTLIRTIPFIPASIKAAKGLYVISKILKTIVPVNVKVVTDLADAVSMSANKFLWGLLKWSILSFFMGGAIRTIKNVTNIFASLNSIGSVNVPKILSVIPVLDKLAEPLLSFAKIGELGPKLISASVSLRILGDSMNYAGTGFLAFARVPWNMISSAGKSLAELVNSLNQVANKVSISPNLSVLVRTLYTLAFAMRTVSTGFASTTKQMAEFNTQTERLKLNTGKAEIATKTTAAGIVGKKGPTTGVAAPVGVFSPTAGAGEQRVRIAPIEINLKLNGTQLQKIIAEANFYKT